MYFFCKLLSSKMNTFILHILHDDYRKAESPYKSDLERQDSCINIKTSITIRAWRYLVPETLPSPQINNLQPRLCSTIFFWASGLAISDSRHLSWVARTWFKWLPYLRSDVGSAFCLSFIQEHTMETVVYQYCHWSNGKRGCHELVQTIQVLCNRRLWLYQLLCYWSRWKHVSTFSHGSHVVVVTIFPSWPIRGSQQLVAAMFFILTNKKATGEPWGGGHTCEIYCCCRKCVVVFQNSVLPFQSI